ncbi:hypothetical protein LCGC14_1721020, partial [marine sediment metagenome]
MNNEEILENYAKRLGSTGKTRRLYLRFASNFLEYAGGEFDREKIDKYLARLRKHKYSDGSVNLIFRTIRTLFSRNNMEWPYNRGESPLIREDKIQAPALDPDIIGEMIQAVKSKGELDEKAFLAISTTYATRRIEMIGLVMDDVRIKDKTIHITTAKHGRERTHMLPEEILPYLEGFDFDVGTSDSEIFALWYRLEYRIGLDHTNQVGWHSVRRTLNTLLLDNLPEATVMSFMRWKQRTSSHMPYRYSAQRFVGREGMSTKVVGE